MDKNETITFLMFKVFYLEKLIENEKPELVQLRRADDSDLSPTDRDAQQRSWESFDWLIAIKQLLDKAEEVGKK